MEKRRMCPNCRAFITVTDRVCPYCDAQVGPRAVDSRGGQFVASFMPRANVTSILILTLNVIFYAGQTLSNGRLTSVGIEYGPYVFLLHQWWRLLTAGFLHGGILHIAMNSWALWILVTEVEQFYGTARLLVSYVVSTFTGFLLSALVSSSPVLGASCAAFGLMGTMLAMGLRGRADPLALAVRNHYGSWLVFGLLMSIGPGISITGHIGGLLGGLAVGFIAGLPGLPGTPRETVWKVAAAAAVLLVALAWLQAGLYMASAS